MSASVTVDGGGVLVVVPPDPVVEDVEDSTVSPERSICGCATKVRGTQANGLFPVFVT